MTTTRKPPSTKSYGIREALAAFLKPYDPAVWKLAPVLRELVISEVAPCHETIFQERAVACP
jgi:hypothetical protein